MVRIWNLDRLFIREGTASFLAGRDSVDRPDPLSLQITEKLGEGGMGEV